MTLPDSLMTCSRTRRGGWGPGPLALDPARGPSQDVLRYDLPVPGRVAEGDLGALGALEVDVHVVLPGEPDAAVDLDPLAGDDAVRVGAVGLRHRRGERRFRDVVRDRPGRVVGRRL